MASLEDVNPTAWLDKARFLSMADIDVEQKKQLYRFLKGQPDGTHLWCEMAEQSRLVCRSSESYFFAE